MSEQDRDRVKEARPRGRPRVEERLEQVGVSLPPAYVKRLEQLAEARDTSVSNVVRQLIIFRLR